MDGLPHESHRSYRHRSYRQVTTSRLKLHSFELGFEDCQVDKKERYFRQRQKELIDSVMKKRIITSLQLSSVDEKLGPLPPGVYRL